MNEECLIQLNGVGRTFLTEQIETRALSDINLEIHRGEFVSISGPSGCGKSTLLSILGLLDDPTAGQYVFESRDTVTMSGRDRSDMRNREIGFIFQNFNLIGELTVFENVELPLKYRGLKKKERRALVESSMAKLGIEHRKDHYPSQLSGGQQQRVAVARAIAGEVKILLADEPTGNLDSKNGEDVINTLKLLNDQGTTICMVTHDERFANSAKRKIELFDGKIV